MKMKTKFMMMATVAIVSFPAFIVHAAPSDTIEASVTFLTAIAVLPTQDIVFPNTFVTGTPSAATDFIAIGTNNTVLSGGGLLSSSTTGVAGEIQVTDADYGTNMAIYCGTGDTAVDVILQEPGGDQIAMDAIYMTTLAGASAPIAAGDDPSAGATDCEGLDIGTDNPALASAVMADDDLFRIGGRLSADNATGGSLTTINVAYSTVAGTPLTVLFNYE